MDRSIDFYVRLLGLELLSRHEIPQNDAEIAFLQDPEGKGARLKLDDLANFQVGPRGLTIIFNPYTMGGYAEGGYWVEVP